MRLRHRVQQLSHEVSKYSSSWYSMYGVVIFSTAAFSSSLSSEETAISGPSEVAGSQAGSSGGCPTHDACSAVLLTQVLEKTVGLLDKGDERHIISEQFVSFMSHTVCAVAEGEPCKVCIWYWPLSHCIAP